VTDVTIKIDSWHQAHHLGCVLADAEYEFRKEADAWVRSHNQTQDEVSTALNAYADFFKRVAKEVTSQAKGLNR
jgi:basic membrane lipoprotein Med (substrate-binding protein (PBP1-ABC) superfamily)